MHSISSKRRVQHGGAMTLLCLLDYSETSNLKKRHKCVN